MSAKDNKILLFITHQPEQLRSVQTYLKKRDHAVHIESNLKEAIVKIFEINVDYIFIAWDHSDKKISILPKILAQSTSAVVIPFIHSNTKESAHQFNLCPCNPKIYPPILGPAIDRLIIKLSKVSSVVSARASSLHSKTATQDEIFKVQQLMVDTLENDPISNLELTTDELTDTLSLETSEVLPNEENLLIQIEKQNQLLLTEKSPLEKHRIEALKRSLNEQVKNPLENILTSMKELRQSNADLHLQKGATLNLTYNPIQQAADASRAAIKSLSAIEPETGNLITFALNITCNTWCGYFVISTNALLESTQIDLIFTDWIKLQFTDLAEINASDYIQISSTADQIIETLSNHADYQETVTVDEKIFHINFLGVDANDMSVQLTEDRVHILILVEQIIPDVILNFNLLLHLPENQKYLLYTQAQRVLSTEQKNRLILKKVKYLYTPKENYKHYQHYLAQKILGSIAQFVKPKERAL